MAHEEIRHYESLTQQIQRIHHSHSRAPSSCMDCEYYHPEWKHRFCLYTKCPYKKMGFTFWDNPYSDDRFKSKEVMGVSGV